MIEKYDRTFASRSELRRFERLRLGPWGCLCQTLSERMVGDGCSICNPAYAEDLEEIAPDEEED